MNEAIDLNGRVIREGDEDRRVGKGRMAVDVTPERVRYWMTGRGEVTPCDRQATPCVMHDVPPRLWTTTHRMGEPIEDVSPMAKDANGAVIERGKVTDRGEVVCVHHNREGEMSATIRREGGLERWWISDLTVIPPEPETIETTVTLRHSPDVDARKLCASLEKVEVVRP